MWSLTNRLAINHLFSFSRLVTLTTQVSRTISCRCSFVEPRLQALIESAVQQNLVFNFHFLVVDLNDAVRNI